MVALLIGLNLATTYLLDRWLGAAVQLAAAVGAVVVAHRRGNDLGVLGLAPSDVPRGLAWGGAVSLVIMVGVTTLALVPATRGFFDDSRFDDADALDTVVEVAFRIPIITALSEELLFRSVLLGLLLAVTTRWAAVLWSSLLFGLWHVLTTIGDLDGNELTEDLGGWEAAGSVAGVVAVTAGAGVLFCGLRLRSGSVVAPWMVHTAINASTFVAGAVLVGGGHI